MSEKFLKFSEGTEMEHRANMGLKKRRDGGICSY